MASCSCARPGHDREGRGHNRRLALHSIGAPVAMGKCARNAGGGLVLVVSTAAVQLPWFFTVQTRNGERAVQVLYGRRERPRAEAGIGACVPWERGDDPWAAFKRQSKSSGFGETDAGAVVSVWGLSPKALAKGLEPKGLDPKGLEPKVRSRWKISRAGYSMISLSTTTQRHQDNGASSPSTSTQRYL